MAKRYQVFVSSTFEDLREQRRKVWETLISFDYVVVGMETFSATNNEQFEYIKKQILDSDYYVIILAGRYGSMADDQISFTEKEFDFAVESEIPVLVFPIEDPDSVAVSSTDKDADKAVRLAAFRQKAKDGRLVQTWKTSDELALGVVKALKNAETAYPRAGWIRGDAPSNETLLTEIRELRLENEKLKKRDAVAADESSSVDLNKSRSEKLLSRRNQL